jgi:prevent-host-death family protein
MGKPPTVVELLEKLVSPPVEYATAAEARERFKDMMEQASTAHVLITHHGKPQVALMDYRLFQTVQQLVLRLASQELRQKAGGKALTFEAVEDEEQAADVAAAVARTRQKRKKGKDVDTVAS